MHEYDKSSKWLIQHHGDSILRLAGVQDIVSWKPLQAEVVQPRQLPDGLLEVQLAGREEPDLFILELASRAESRLVEQILRDLTLVYLDRRALPEVLTVILSPQGGVQAEHAQVLFSRLGWTRWQIGWHVVELWKLSAQDLLAVSDVGIVPWVPLSNFAEDPADLLRRCRQRIDDQAPPEEHESLLAVTRVLASLRYNDPQLLALFGGKEMMIEFPAIQELVAEIRQEDILRVLAGRLGDVPQDIATAVRGTQDKSRLDDLVHAAAVCPDWSAFRVRLAT